MKNLFFYCTILLCAIRCYAAVSQETASKPNIVWIVSEDNSKHYLKMFDPNGIETPNIESLSEEGLTFDRAFSNAAVCSAARSTLASGVYGPRIASHYHRKIVKTNMPSDLEYWLKYLSDAGYSVTNFNKTDFNINQKNFRWSSPNGTQGWINDYGWRDREDDQPFFYFHTIHTTHEKETHFRNTEEETPVEPASVFVDPRYPNTNMFRYSSSLYRKRISQMDTQVGQVIDELKNDGLYDDTFIFYFSDHGGTLPGTKGYNFETGLHIPLVVHVPENFKNLVDFELGSRVEGFVDFVDFGPTVLNLAGVDIPEGFDGTPFLGADVTEEQVNAQDETFSYADRFDEKYDFVRSVRKGQYKYTRNYEPFNPSSLYNQYRYQQIAFQEWREYYLRGELDNVAASFFDTKPIEMLYDVKSDPYETVNLASVPAYQDILVQMRGRLSHYLDESNDLSFYPEFYLIENAINDPAAFGESHSSALAELQGIADLQLSDYATAAPSISSALASDDDWKRYWALIVASSFGEEASALIPEVKALAEDEQETRFNKMRAYEFLALNDRDIDADSLAAEITNNMYAAESLAEALLYLNSMAMLKETRGYQFSIDRPQMDSDLVTKYLIQARLNYLFSVPNTTDAPVVPIGRYEVVSTSATELRSERGRAEHVFDDHGSTFWHTQYNINSEKGEELELLPKEFVFKLDDVYDIEGFRYLPRQNDNPRGRIRGYKLYASNSLETLDDESSLISEGEWENSILNKDVLFETIEAQYFKLVATSEWGGQHNIVIAELRVFGSVSQTDDNDGEDDDDTDDGDDNDGGDGDDDDGDDTDDGDGDDTDDGQIDDEVLAVSDVKSTDHYTLYPNPTTDLIYIKGFKGKGIGVITDVAGKQILSFELLGSSSAITVSSLEKGIYVLNIFNHDNNSSSSLQFVKE